MWSGCKQACKHVKGAFSGRSLNVTEASLKHHSSFNFAFWINFINFLYRSVLLAKWGLRVGGSSGGLQAGPCCGGFR